MLGSKRVLALIPARGGSRGLPRKNVLPLGDKPLIAWTIDAARNSSHIDRLILSSDDDEIIQVARDHGCDIPFKRPAELATDQATAISVVHHAVQTCPGYDYLVLLQPTSPLRLAEDIDACLQICEDTKAPACVTVTTSDKPPQWMYFLTPDHAMTPVLPQNTWLARRQDARAAYLPNGAVYVARTDWIMTQDTFITPATRAHIMPPERSCDIDTPLDMILVKHLIGEQRH